MSFDPGQKLHAGDLTILSVTGNGSSAQTTSTSYTSLGVSIQYTVPLAGQIEVEATGDLWSSSATEHVYLAVGVNDIYGNVLASPSDAEAAYVYGTLGVRCTSMRIVTGLEPGIVVVVMLYLRSTNTSATANAWQTRLTVEAA